MEFAPPVSSDVWEDDDTYEVIRALLRLALDDHYEPNKTSDVIDLVIHHSRRVSQRQAVDVMAAETGDRWTRDIIRSRWYRAVETMRPTGEARS